MMIKVKSNKKVNIRAFEPYQRSNNLKGELNAGFEIEVEEVEGQYIEEGEGLDKIASTKWYKDKNGDYYWSGGFQSTGIENELTTKGLIRDYNAQLLNISDSIRKNKGEGTTIAVLDTGIYSAHEVFKSGIIEIHSFTNDDGIDKDGHGTHCASIIGAKNLFGGIAPKATIISCKVAPSSMDFSSESVIKAFEFLRDNRKVDVINMSFQIASQIAETRINTIIQQFPASTLFVAAARNNDKLFKSYLSYPAKNKNVLSVGQISGDVLTAQLNSGATFNADLDILMEYFPYLAADIESGSDLENPIGSSFSAALISGLGALTIADYKLNNKPYDRDTVKDAILHMAIKIKAELLDQQLKIFKP